MWISLRLIDSNFSFLHFEHLWVAYFGIRPIVTSFSRSPSAACSMGPCCFWHLEGAAHPKDFQCPRLAPLSAISGFSVQVAHFFIQLNLGDLFWAHCLEVLARHKSIAIDRQHFAELL